MGAREATVFSPDGLTLRYEVEGPDGVDGTAGAPSPPLLCAAGGPGRASEYFGDLGGLTARRTVVRLDTRGTGRSTAPDDPAGYAPDRLVADLDAVRADLVEPRIDLLGHSAGGPVALAYAAAHPERVRRLVLVTTYLQAGPEADEEREVLKASRADEPWYAEAREAEEGMQYARPAEQQRLSRLLRPFYYGVWDERTAAHADAADHQMSPRAEAGIGVHWRAAAERAHQLLAVEAPTLVVLGALDVITPPAGGRRMAEQLPSAQVVVLGGAGHFPWVDGGPAFAETVATFLEAS